MLIFGQEAGGNPRALSLIHATRVMGIIWVAPTLMAMIWQIDLHKPPGVPLQSVPVLELLLMPICGLLGWKIAERIRLFGASILGPMILTAIVSLSGLIHTWPPAEILWCAQFFIGISVGVHYSGITLAELRRDIFAGGRLQPDLGHYQRLFYHMIINLGIASELNALLAFLAGGQAEMMMIAGYYRSRFNLRTDAPLDSLGIGGVGGTHCSPTFVMKKQLGAANAHLTNTEGRS